MDAVRERFFCQSSMSMVVAARGYYCTSLQSSITRSAPRRYDLHDPRQLRAAARPIHGGSRYPVYRAYHTEIVPYTNRTHLVRWSPQDARETYELDFPRFKAENASKILDHPDTHRVHGILSKIVDAIPRSSAIAKQKSLNWVDQLNWEVIIFMDEEVSVTCYPAGGKIVVSTGFLDHFNTDNEIAAALAHEVGHVVARHTSEMIYRLPYILRTPFLRRNELEADHIGIMLLASAGFDPHIAPRFFDKAGRIRGESWFINLLASVMFVHHYPSCKKISRILTQPKVMEAAMKLYRQATSAYYNQGHDKV